MDAERWQQIRPILESALELDVSSREAFLDAACGDMSLRREIDSLLVSHDEAGGEVLNPDTLPLKSEDELRLRLLSGKRIGVYQILDEIAVGGMGAVYRAERADGQYKQKVALKIVRADIGAGLTAARFRGERQILASLDHPNIAKILDGGTTADGIPYFVMEFIDGLPITDYCDRHKLSTDGRLKLFRNVCSAVYYAHQHLVIHRDIKPTNILVTEEGAPKLLDFGIAKILDPSLLSEHLTQTGGSWLMTPEYASPEQFRGEAITTASDVYSLGLLLYELLAGRPAYRFPSRMPHEIARVVLETEPETPNLGDDLDNVIMKAIRKEPRERYNSADQLSEDVRRHLEGLPVLARKATIMYRASKFISRHALGVSSAAIAVIAVLVGLVVAVYEAQVAHVQQARAEARFKDVRALANSLLFELHDSIQDLPGSTPARKLLVERALRYLDGLSRDAASDTSLQRELATAYEKVGTVQGNPFGANLGDTQGALGSYRKALAIRSSLSVAHPRNADDMAALARIQRLIGALLSNRGDASSITEVKRALVSAERAFQIAPSNAQVLHELQATYYMLAVLLDSLGDYKGSEANCRKALLILEQRVRAAPGDQVLRQNLATTETRMAHELASLGSPQESFPYFKRGLQLFESLSRNGSDAEATRRLGIAHSMFGEALLLDSNPAGALKEFQENRRIATALSTADPKNAVVQYDLGCAIARAGNAAALMGSYAAGMNMLNQAARMFEVQLARDPAYSEPRYCLARTYAWMGEDLAMSGEHVRALEKFQNALAVFQKLAAEGAGMVAEPDLALMHANIARELAIAGKREQASAEYQLALRIAELIISANPNISEARYGLADIYFGLGKLAQMSPVEPRRPLELRVQNWNEARGWYQHSLDAWQKIHNPSARTPMGFACGSPRTVARELAKCDAELALLNRRAKQAAQ